MLVVGCCCSPASKLRCPVVIFVMFIHEFVKLTHNCLFLYVAAKLSTSDIVAAINKFRNCHTLELAEVCGCIITL